MTTDARDGFSFDLHVKVPVERVWRALRDPADIRRWHGWDAPGLDEEIAFIYAEHATQGDSPYSLMVEPLDTISLEPGEDGTVVGLRRAPRDAVPEWADAYDDITQGWVSFLHQLRFALERHPDEDRRTLFWQGAGDPRCDLLDEQALPAEVIGRWFHTGQQDGLILDGVGPGLLLIWTKDATAGGPATTATLSTYNVADDEWAGLRERWTAWFRGAFPDAEPPQEHVAG